MRVVERAGRREARESRTGSTPPEGRPPRRITRSLVLVFAVAVGLSVATNYLAQPLLDTLRRDLHLSGSVAGLIVTVAQGGYAAGLIFLLPLGDLLERRRLATFLSAATAVFLLAVALAPSAGVLLPALALVGMTSAVAQILVPFAAGLAGDDERGRVVGTVMSGLLIGIMLARVFSGAVAQAAGWRTVYWIAAGLLLMQALLLRWRLPRYREGVRVAYPRLLTSVLGIAAAEPLLRRRAVYGGLSFASISAFWTVLAFLLAGPPFNYGEATIGLFSLVGTLGAVMAMVTGRLNDRGWSRQLTGLAGVGLLACAPVLYVGGRSLSALIVGIMLLNVAAQAMHITNQSLIYRLRPAARSRINAFYMTSYFAGGVLGSASAAFVRLSGWWAVCLLIGGFGAVALVMWVAESIRGRGPASQT
jgi:predicted MFS family arabinose efflux permease